MSYWYPDDEEEEEEGNDNNSSIIMTVNRSRTENMMHKRDHDIYKKDNQATNTLRSKQTTNEKRVKESEPINA